MKTQKEILETLGENTHTLMSEAFLDEACKAFKVKINPIVYDADGDRDPKGLTMNDGSPTGRGIASFDLAEILCSRLNVKYRTSFGRGTQVRNCISALREAGYGQD